MPRQLWAVFWAILAVLVAQRWIWFSEVPTRTEEINRFSLDAVFMTVPLFPPRRDADLLTWSANFAARIAASPAMYGLDAAQAAGFSALQSAYASAYRIAVSPTTNSKANVGAKNEARENLLDAANGAWELVPIVRAFPGMTDGLGCELGLRLADRHRSPVGPPSSPPNLSIKSVLGRSIKLRLRDIDHRTRRGKPEGVEGAIVLYCIGQSCPSDIAQWHFALITARPRVDFELPWSVPAASKVWLTAFWFNARKESGPMCTPKSTIIGEGLALAA